jgi:hypothetical protein
VDVVGVVAATEAAADCGTSVEESRIEEEEEEEKKEEREKINLKNWKRVRVAKSIKCPSFLCLRCREIQGVDDGVNWAHAIPGSVRLQAWIVFFRILVWLFAIGHLPHPFTLLTLNEQRSTAVSSAIPFRNKPSFVAKYWILYALMRINVHPPITRNFKQLQPRFLRVFLLCLCVATCRNPTLPIQFLPSR